MCGPLDAASAADCAHAVIRPKIDDPAVKARIAAADSSLSRREAPLREQAEESSAANSGLPAYPTTTIGSFPQTPEVRKARADYGEECHRRGRV